MSEPGTELASHARDLVERLTRAQCTIGEIAASLWSCREPKLQGQFTREEARRFVTELGDDLVAWKLAGRAEVRLAAHECVVGSRSLSPGQAAAQGAWAKQHLGWDKQGMDPAKQGQAEQRDAAGASKLKVAG